MVNFTMVMILLFPARFREPKDLAVFESLKIWLTQLKPAGNAINHPENIQPDRTSDRHRVLQLCLGFFVKNSMLP